VNRAFLKALESLEKNVEAHILILENTFHVSEQKIITGGRRPLVSPRQSYGREWGLNSYPPAPGGGKVVPTG